MKESSSSPSSNVAASKQGDELDIIACAAHLKRSRHGKRIILGSSKNNSHKSGIYKGAVKADPVRLMAITRAHIWFEDLKSGQSYKTIANRQKIDQRHVARAIRLAFLAPD